MAKQLTFTGRSCPECGSGCSAHDYGGLCGKCWVELSADERAILGGGPVKEVVTYRTVEMSPRQPFLAAVKFLWAALVTVAVAWLAWRMR
jgi:hypothetical protein